MNPKKKLAMTKPSDMTYINAAALQDHYLRTINLDLKQLRPPRLPAVQRPVILKQSAQQILSWAHQLQQQNDQVFQHQQLQPSASSFSTIPSSNRGIDTDQPKPVRSQPQAFIRIGHHKVVVTQTQNLVRTSSQQNKRSFLPALPDQIDAIRKEKEVKSDKVKMTKYKQSLTLAQRLGIVAAPPKPLTREDWVSIEEQSKKREEGACPICLEDFKDSKQIILSCSHVFHKQCLESFEKHNKVNSCPICRRQHYDKKHWDEGYKKYIVKCALLIQTLWRGGKARFAFFTRLLESKYKANSARLRRKILGYKLGKFNAKIETAIDASRKQATKQLAKIDENIKRNIAEMYAQITQIQNLKDKNESDANEFLNSKIILAAQRNPDYQRVLALEEENLLKEQQEKSGQVISEVQWNQIKEKALGRCDKDCAICFGSIYNPEDEAEKASNNPLQPPKKQKKGLFVLSCTHVFHANCLAAFERYNLQENQVCPICRANYQKQHFVLQAQSQSLS